MSYLGYYSSIGDISSRSGMWVYTQNQLGETGCIQSPFLPHRSATTEVQLQRLVYALRSALYTMTLKFRTCDITLLVGHGH